MNNWLFYTLTVIGAFIGNKLLKKTTISFLKWTVTLFMLAIGILMIFGILNVQ